MKTKQQKTIDLFVVKSEAEILRLQMYVQDVQLNNIKTDIQLLLLKAALKTKIEALEKYKKGKKHKLS
jgi:hypothetical protein